MEKENTREKYALICLELALKNGHDYLADHIIDLTSSPNISQESLVGHKEEPKFKILLKLSNQAGDIIFSIDLINEWFKKYGYFPNLNVPLAFCASYKMLKKLMKMLVS